MTRYELEVYRRHLEEFAIEARELSRQFPNLRGAVISGEPIRPPSRSDAWKPDRARFPVVRGWEKRPIRVALRAFSSTYLYSYEDEADSFMAYRRLATTIHEYQIQYESTSVDREKDRLLIALSPEMHLQVAAILSQSKIIKSPVMVDRYSATHADWLGRCDVSVICDDLFRVVARDLATSLAGLSVMQAGIDQPKDQAHPCENPAAPCRSQLGNSSTLDTASTVGPATLAPETRSSRRGKPRDQGKGAKCLAAYVEATQRGEEPPTPTELASRFDCSVSVASRAISSLERRRREIARTEARDRYRDHG